MSLFEDETLGEKLDREARVKAKAQEKSRPKTTEELMLEKLQEINKSVSRTENNVAFFFWLTIISGVIYAWYQWSLT